jgi:hypothetical protein
MLESRLKELLHASPAQQELCPLMIEQLVTNAQKVPLRLLVQKLVHHVLQASHQQQEPHNVPRVRQGHIGLMDSAMHALMVHIP